MKKAILKPCKNCAKNGYDNECYCIGIHCGSLVMENGNMFLLMTFSDSELDELFVPVAVAENDMLVAVVPAHDELCAEVVAFPLTIMGECNECYEEKPLSEFVEIVEVEI